ncbi:MAG: SufD family Fe-S cluster assembly protein [Burkholderiaceae bacterium]
MNNARADALFARSRITEGNWITRSNESFRHLPPPAAAVWLGDPATDAQHDCDASPLDGAGWTLHPVGDTTPARIDARWLDASDPTQRAELFADVPLPEGTDDAAPFAWAHRALCRNGLRLRIGNASGRDADSGATVWLQLRHQPRAQVEAPMLVIDIEPGVHCVLIEPHERGAGACQHALVQNLHVHVRLGANASMRHLRIVSTGPQDRVAHLVHARLARGALYHQALVASGSDYHLQRSVVDLSQGEQARARVAGVLLANGTTLEQQVRVVHAAPRAASVVEALALGSGKARIVVNAHALIAAGADATDVRQRLSGVPTGGQPKLVLRPQLEIYHDNVQAVHGATWGALPEDVLFYAAQRGLDERDARALIVEGMARASLAACLETPGLMDSLDVDAMITRSVARHLDAAPEVHHG